MRDHITNRDVKTGEEVPPSAVVTPATATLSEMLATSVISALEKTVFSETKEMAPSPTGVSTTNPDHPSSAPQALPYTGLNVSVFFLAFIIMDGWLMFVLHFSFKPASRKCVGDFLNVFFLS